MESNGSTWRDLSVHGLAAEDFSFMGLLKLVAVAMI